MPARPVTAEDKDLSETALGYFGRLNLGWYHEHIRPFGMNVLFIFTRSIQPWLPLLAGPYQVFVHERY